MISLMFVNCNHQFDLIFMSFIKYRRFREINIERKKEKAILRDNQMIIDLSLSV